LQKFYNNASRAAFYGRSGAFSLIILPKIPDYVDLKQANCTAQQNPYNQTASPLQCGLAIRHTIFTSLLFIPLLIRIIVDI
jgi:hypothetical protein